MADTLILCGLIFVAALLYSSVGHAGASGYLAAMAFMGILPEVMKPAALVLNILVAMIGTIRFYRAGHFSFALLWPFAIGSIPLAFIGGFITLPGLLYKPAVGVVLLAAAGRLFWSIRKKDKEPDEKSVHPLIAVVSGAVIGLLAGLTGTGGGIFLTPLLLFMRWAETKRAAAISIAFILVNSVAGLAGHLAKMQTLPPYVGYWAIAAVAGGLLGSELGSKRLGHPALRFLLGVVLVVAAGKLILTR